jgi:hypothetical protein
MHIRTRFAPSPTGFIHLGNLRSALYPWAFARHNQGDFILRIEDTDLERSTQEAVDVIIEGMAWLGLDLDEGPIYQMQRIDRYREVVKQLLDAGLAYPCYMSEDDLNILRDAQMANKEKPRYNGLWRPEPGKTLPAIPEGVLPVIRFKNPIGGSVIWDDAVKGQIEISNDELDDLVIARPDGTPTYNFCVVVDDLDMNITHVIRGDDHVNNTPRQINIMRALGGVPPIYAHLPTVLNDSGEKMSKRNGAMRGGICLRCRLGVSYGIKYREAEVGCATFAGGNATDHFSAVRDHLLRVEAAFFAGHAAYNHPRVAANENRHPHEDTGLEPMRTRLPCHSFVWFRIRFPIFARIACKWLPCRVSLFSVVPTPSLRKESGGTVT